MPNTVEESISIVRSERPQSLVNFTFAFLRIFIISFVRVNTRILRPGFQKNYKISDYEFVEMESGYFRKKLGVRELLKLFQPKGLRGANDSGLLHYFSCIRGLSERPCFDDIENFE
jgi:hypothetical protein